MCATPAANEAWLSQLADLPPTRVTHDEALAAIDAARDELGAEHRSDHGELSAEPRSNHGSSCPQPAEYSLDRRNKID